MQYNELPGEVQQKIDNVVVSLLQKTEAAERFDKYMKAWDIAAQRLQDPLEKQRADAYNDLHARLSKVVIDAAAAQNTDRARVAVEARQAEILTRAMEYKVSAKATDQVKQYIADNAGNYASGKIDRQTILHDAADKMRGARLNMERAVRCATVAGADKTQLTLKVENWLSNEYRRIDDVARFASLSLSMDKDSAKSELYKALGYGQPEGFATQHDAQVFVEKSNERHFDFRDWMETEKSIDTDTHSSDARSDEAQGIEAGTGSAITAVNGLVRAAGSAVDHESQRVKSWADEALEQDNGKKQTHKSHDIEEGYSR